MIGISLVCGIALGAVFFWALKLNSDLYVSEGFSWTGLILHIGRFGLVGSVFWVMSNFGALPLLICFGGFLIGRVVFMKLITGVIV
jgi:hypothetical protein